LFTPTSDGHKPCFEHLIFESNKIKFTKYVTIVTHVKQIGIYFSHKDNKLSRSTYQAMPKLFEYTSSKKNKTKLEKYLNL